MTASGWIQLAIYVGLLLALTKPMGLYLLRMLDPKQGTFLNPALRPIIEHFLMWGTRTTF